MLSPGAVLVILLLLVAVLPSWVPFKNNFKLVPLRDKAIWYQLFKDIVVVPVIVVAPLCQTFNTLPWIYKPRLLVPEVPDPCPNKYRYALPAAPAVKYAQVSIVKSDVPYEVSCWFLSSI